MASSFGPFENYAPPGAYSRTQVEDDTTGPPSGNRIPIFVGTGRETLARDDFEMVRGSSASVDQRIVNENVNDLFVLDFSNRDNPELGTKTGAESRFQVKNFPIVSGDGRGIVTNDTTKITVTVDGNLVSPAALDGERGIITLQVAPQPGEDVRVTYFFNREDSEFEDDVSEQVTDGKAILLSTVQGPYAISVRSETLNLLVDGVEYPVTLTTGTRTAAEVAGEIDAAINAAGFGATVVQDNQGDDLIQLESEAVIEVLTGTANNSIGFRVGSKTQRNRTFYVYNAPIVDGTNGGITTTDPSDITVHVDGSQVIPTELDGQSGAVTLSEAPVAGATVVVQYFHNTWQDTFDYLPDTGIRNVARVGISPGRRDFLEGSDYVVDANGRLLWGSAATVETGQHTGGDVFGETQIDVSLVDNRIFLEEVDRWVDRSVTPSETSNKIVVLGQAPTLGNGRSTDLDLDLFQRISNDRIPVSTYRPGLVKIYHGSTLSEAQDRGPVEVHNVDPTTRRVTLSEAIPTDHEIYATYYYNRLQDDTVTVKAESATTYSVTSSTLAGALSDVRFGALSDPSVNVNWKTGANTNLDAFVTGTSGIEETVRVRFKTLAGEPAIFVNSEVAPYDFHENESDTLHVEVLEAPSLALDLSAAGRAVLVSDTLDGDPFSITGDNDTFIIEVDGEEVSVDLTGLTTGADIAGEINDAVEASTLGVGDAVAFFRDEADGPARFIIRSREVPTGPDDITSIKVLEGNANETLGFVDNVSVSGSESAVNKGATLLGDAVTAPLTEDLDFIFTLNGTEHTVALSDADALAAIVTKIDTEITSGTAVEVSGAIRITSSDDSQDSSIEILDGTANEALGFSKGDKAAQRQATAGEVAATLNEQLVDWTDMAETLAFVSAFPVLGDGTYIQFATFGTGSAQSFLFEDGTASALNMTGFGIDPEDSTSGSDEIAAFDVDSFALNDLGSPNPVGTGSSGSGVVGQTYTDANTGLRFTVGGGAEEIFVSDYPDTEYFTLHVSSVFTAGAGTSVRAIPGIEMTVDDTGVQNGLGEGDTAIVTTYHKDGQEPSIGDFYYISYEYEKVDFSTRLFTRFRDIQANFGSLSVENPLTLASYLAILNGAVVVGCKQVLKSEGGAQAPAGRYLDALEELGRPLDAGIVPDILVPLTTDPSVMGAYVNHASIQSSMRYRQERRCLFGVASGTLPKDARSIAQGLNSERAILVYPDSAVVTLTDPLGDDRSFIVDGTYIAAALAGVQVSPQFDVATPLTRRTVVGFRRLNRSLDDIDKNKLAGAGITVLEDRGTSLVVRDGLTTNTESRFTSTPSIIAIKDHVQRQSRNTLDRFIGLKFLSSRSQDVELALTGLLNSLVQQQIIVDFQGVRAEPDPNDPTSLRVSAFYAPIFPLKYIPITYTIGASSSF